jgi:hypothetical protein
MPKLKLPAPVTIAGPSGEVLEITARQVIDHVVRTGRELGASSDVEQVRRGARILAAAESGGELSSDDLDALKAALGKPARGWMSVAVDVQLQVAPNAPPRTVRRHLVPQGIDLLPIIDGLLAS